MPILSLPAPQVQPSSFADDLLSALEAYRYPVEPDALHSPDGPTTADEAWETGFQCGASGEAANASSDYSPLLAAIWDRGYAAGEAQRWREYSEWATEYDRYLDFCRDMDETDRRRVVVEQERRGGWGGHADHDA